MIFIRWATWCSHSVFRRWSKSPTHRSRGEWAVIVVTVAYQSIGEMAPEKPNPESVSLTRNASEKTLCSPYIPSGPFSWGLFLSCLYGCQWQRTVVSFSQQTSGVWTRAEISILAQEFVACVHSSVTVCVSTPWRQQSGARCFSSSIWTLMLVYKLAASHFNLCEYELSDEDLEGASASLAVFSSFRFHIGNTFFQSLDSEKNHLLKYFVSLELPVLWFLMHKTRAF